MVNKKKPDCRSVDGNSSTKVSPSEAAAAGTPVLRRSPRENAWGRQSTSISQIPINKPDIQTKSIPSSSRKSGRPKKLLRTSVQKIPQTSEENLTSNTDTVNKLQTPEEQGTPSPLRRSDRNKKEVMLSPSSLKRKRMDGRTYRTLFSPQHGSDTGEVKNGLETVLEVNHEKLEENPPSRYVEYWVPASISTVQLEQYCAVLLANSITLCSCSKNDLVGVLHSVVVATHKCCDHPYTVDPSLQGLLVEGLSPPEYLDVGIKASGKLQLLDTILSEIRNMGLRVLILFQYISGFGRDTIGDILDDFIRQRFGQDSYERLDAGLTHRTKQAAIKRFNDKNSDRFVFLLELRACQSSVKLSSVDSIIVFDSDWNPSLDLKALKRMSIDSSHKQIKIFRLYSPFTLEEKVLILAAQNVTIDNNLLNIKKSTCHELLKWGASCLFKKLDIFHDADRSCSDISLEASHLKDVSQEFLDLLRSHDEDHIESSLIVKVEHSDGTYLKNIQLLGEREIQNVADESQLFWTNLLDGRSPKWKHPSGQLQRNRKRVNYSDELNEESHDELDVGNKRKKTCSIHLSPSHELRSNETELTEKGDLGGLEPVCVTELLNEEASDMQKKFHLLLKSKIAKVSEVLQLSDDVKIIAGKLLDYIIDNHHISREPESIFQAFQISLCWNAASLAKNKIDKDNSLVMVKKYLNFSCTEEEANHAYSNMQDLGLIFLEKSSKEPTTKDMVSITDDGPIAFPLAERVTCLLQTSNVQNAEKRKLSEITKQDYRELIQNFLRQFPVENETEIHLKQIKKNYLKHLESLMMQQQEEINDLEKQMDLEKDKLIAEHRLRVAVVCSIHNKHSIRSGKLQKLERDFSKRMSVHHRQKEACLEERHAKHLSERIIEMNKATVEFEKLKYLSPPGFPGDSSLHIFEPVVVGDDALCIGGSESASCVKVQTDEACLPSEEPELVSNEPTMCIDDLSSAHGAVSNPLEGLNLIIERRGSSAIDTFPGVLNSESEQQSHCSPVDTTGNLEQSNLPLQHDPDQDLSSLSKAPTKSSSMVMEVSDSITATEVIAEYCQTDKTNLVVVNEMRDENEEPVPVDETPCGEPVPADETPCGEPVQVDETPCEPVPVDETPCAEPETSEMNRGTSEQVSIVGSQTGVDSCNNELILSQETIQTPTSNHLINMQGPPTVQNQLSMHEPVDSDWTNTLLPPNADTNTLPPPNADTNTLLPPNADVSHQQCEGIRGEPPEQLIASRNLASLPSVNVFPLGVGTHLHMQLPMLTAQSMISNLPNHVSDGDPLQIEADRLCREMDQLKKALDDKRTDIESARAKELEEINKKYNAMIHEAEIATDSSRNELLMRRDIVLNNKILAEAFRTKRNIKIKDLHYGLPFISHMQQFSVGSLGGRHTTDNTITTCEIPTITPSLPTSNVHQPSPIISNMPTLAQHIPSFTPPTTSHHGHGELRTPPHLRARQQPYPFFVPYNRPVRPGNGTQLGSLNPLLTPIGAFVNADNRRGGFPTPTRTPSPYPVTSASFPSSRPITPSSFPSTRSAVPQSGHSGKPANQVELGAAFQADINARGAHQVELGAAFQADMNARGAHQVVCLSDDEEQV